MRPLALLHSLYEVLKVIVCVALLVQAEDGEVKSEGGREGKQFGSGRPGSGMRSRGQLTRLEQGPLTLQGGKLRPVVERLNRPNPGPIDRVGGARPGLQRRPGVLPLLHQNTILFKDAFSCNARFHIHSVSVFMQISGIS